MWPSIKKTLQIVKINISCSVTPLTHKIFNFHIVFKTPRPKVLLLLPPLKLDKKKKKIYVQIALTLS